MDTTKYKGIDLDVQGHRGCRGLMPENSLPAFKKAFELGVNTMELDIAISKDKKVVVSHEPWFNPEICQIEKEDLSEEELAFKYNLYNMSYEEIAQMDCGSKVFRKYPDQEKIATSKPLLSDVIQLVEQLSKKSQSQSLYYNIEIKYRAEGENVFHPDRSEFIDLFYGVISEAGVADRSILQCFDPEVLNIVHQRYPTLKTALLVSNDLSINENLSKLNFKPDIYSCNYKLLDKDSVAELHAKDILVIPWTVNKVKQMAKLIDYGVDGIITDYPDRLINLIKLKQLLS